jgi:hypothetical protein
MSLFKTTTNFATIVYESGPDKEEIIELLNSLPDKNIIGNEDLSHFAYKTQLKDNPQKEFICTDRYIYGVEVIHQKKLPIKKIKDLIEKDRKENPDYAGLSKKEFKDGYYYDLYDELSRKEAPYCSVKTSLTDFIIDLEKKTIYLNLKSTGALNLSVYYFTKHLKIKEPRIQGNITLDLVRAWPGLNSKLSTELFLFWIYKKATSEQIGDLGIKMNLSVKDHKSDIKVKGELERFDDVFMVLKDERQIKELSLALPSPDDEEENLYSFTINPSVDGMKNFKHLGHSFSGVSYADLGSRVASFEKINTYIRRLFHKFQKDILDSGIDSYYSELRGKEVDNS